MSVLSGHERYLKSHPRRKDQVDGTSADNSSPAPSVIHAWRQQRAATRNIKKPRTTAEILADGLAAVERVDRERAERAAGLRS